MLDALLLTATLVLHEYGACPVLIDVTPKEVTVAALCPTESGADLDPESGVIRLTVGHFNVFIPLPSPKWTGWIEYRTGQGKAYLFGEYAVPVQIELLEEI